jgi:hypothetical protein
MDNQNTNKIFTKNNSSLTLIKPKKVGYDPLKVINLKTLITKKHYPDIRYFVKPFLPEGLSILAGKAKIKKSFFSLDMAISIAQGRRFLKKFICDKTTVYYLPMEDNFRRVQTRAKIMLGKSKIIPDNLIMPYIPQNFPKLNQGGLNCLKKIIEERPDVGVIIIDTYGKFIDKKFYGKQSFQQDYDILSELQTFAIKKHIAVLLIHHTIKSQAEDPYDEMQGTMGTQASPDSLLIMRNYKGVFQLCVKGRDFEEQTYLIEFNNENCKWSVKGNDREYGLTVGAQKLLQYFKDNPTKEFTLMEIHSLTKHKKKQNTRNMLKRLASKHLICNKNRNVYKLDPDTYSYLIEENVTSKEEK